MDYKFQIGKPIANQRIWSMKDEQEYVLGILVDYSLETKTFSVFWYCDNEPTVYPIKYLSFLERWMEIYEVCKKNMKKNKIKVGDLLYSKDDNTLGLVIKKTIQDGLNATVVMWTDITDSKYVYYDSDYRLKNWSDDLEEFKKKYEKK